MDWEESMKCRKSLWFQGAALLLIAVTVLLAPGAGAQNQYKTLHRFKGGEDGEFMYAGLVFDAAGNLYGTTVLGGDRSLCNKSSGCGVVFKLTPNSNGKWTETVLHRFLARPGSLPYAGLVFDASGNLYGTTFGDIKVDPRVGV
jgi:uncharacterized repeat protein (TIGR03803 family)